MSVATALLFFGSVLAHELAHSLISQAHGVGVRDITLFIFWGSPAYAKNPEAPELDMITIAAKAAHTQTHNHYWMTEFSRKASREEVLDAFRAAQCLHPDGRRRDGSQQHDRIDEGPGQTSGRHVGGSRLGGRADSETRCATATRSTMKPSPYRRTLTPSAPWPALSKMDRNPLSSLTRL